MKYVKCPSTFVGGTKRHTLCVLMGIALAVQRRHSDTRSVRACSTGSAHSPKGFSDSFRELMLGIEQIGAGDKLGGGERREGQVHAIVETEAPATNAACS